MKRCAAPPTISRQPLSSRSAMRVNQASALAPSLKSAGFLKRDSQIDMRYFSEGALSIRESVSAHHLPIAVIADRFLALYDEIPVQAVGRLQVMPVRGRHLSGRLVKGDAAEACAKRRERQRLDRLLAGLVVSVDGEQGGPSGR